MTIAQKLEITQFPYEIKDSKGRQIYYETSDGYWEIQKYDSTGNRITLKNSSGYRVDSVYNENGKCLYNKTATGYSERWEYNEEGRVKRYEKQRWRVGNLGIPIKRQKLLHWVIYKNKLKKYFRKFHKKFAIPKYSSYIYYII
jgi:hypothetical protein